MLLSISNTWFLHTRAAYWIDSLFTSISICFLLSKYDLNKLFNIKIKIEVG